MGIDQNFKGEGEIKGGLFIDGRDKSGIACQFIERNFDDWAPVAEISKWEILLFLYYFISERCGLSLCMACLNKFSN
ncbi:hypothetical protein OIU76_011817 [Salix suchowensis]|nr:hypothetical protein OIU76_011817 [Salix suchowensis]